MANIIRTFIAVSLLVVTSIALADESGPIDVLIFPFEVHGQADPAFAHSAHQRISTAVESDSRFKVIADGDAVYHVKGYVHADNMRHFVGLTLLDASTGQMLWFENFDYIGITPEMMAAELTQALASASQSGRG